MKRRTFFHSGIALATSGTVIQTSCQSTEPDTEVPFKNNINHSVCAWCFGDMPLEEILQGLKKIGIRAIDLIGPADWGLLKTYDIECSMCNGAEISLTEGWNRKENHPQLIENYLKHIELASDAGYKNLICFSGNRDGMDDQLGLENCAEGLKQIMSFAEEKNIIIQMELFNSLVNHPDYMCDSSEWGIALVDLIGSDNFKLLYDIYHMQVQEGNIIQTIQNSHNYFGHYHTAGVPGRHEIDETQELYYPAIMKAILDTGYDGFVAQEFIPKREDIWDSFEQGIRICDV